MQATGKPMRRGTGGGPLPHYCPGYVSRPGFWFWGEDRVKPEHHQQPQARPAKHHANSRILANICNSCGRAGKPREGGWLAPGAGGVFLSGSAVCTGFSSSWHKGGLKDGFCDCSGRQGLLPFVKGLVDWVLTECEASATVQTSLSRPICATNSKIPCKRHASQSGEGLPRPACLRSAQGGQPKFTSPLAEASILNRPQRPGQYLQTRGQGRAHSLMCGRATGPAAIRAEDSDGKRAREPDTCPAGMSSPLLLPLFTGQDACSFWSWLGPFD